ncbi:MAG TPA: hypothetical protein VFO96_09965 [Gemmatimonadales bacterium]|jgi:hypothetical protein|nr:hypothetical protein [Gemmatimonadales bacterium]
MRASMLLTLAATLVAACDAGTPSQPEPSSVNNARQGAPAPSGVITTGVAGMPGSLTFFPYTRTEFASGENFDPINLAFTGHADPRTIRAILIGLDGNRTAALGDAIPGYPPVAPFNCRWHDAIGDMQTAYGGDAGWAGSVVQLACGDFGPVRFHLRLFRLGAFTVANAHFEMLIPGTADHQVLSWERAEEFVGYDMLRSGLVNPATVSATEVINATEHRTILKDLWNALASSADGQAVLGFVRLDFGNPAPFVDQDQPIRNGDGRATVLDVTADVPSVPGTFSEVVPIDFGQDIPRPFCADVPRFLHVSGHLDLSKSVTIDAMGNYSSSFSTSGKLDARDLVSGVRYFANVAEHQESAMSDSDQSALATVDRRELPASGAGNGSLSTRLKVGPSGVTQFERREACE